VIPLRDVIPSRTTPYVTITLIGVNVLVFLFEVMLPESDLRTFLFSYGLVPSEFSWFTAVTAMFVHASFMHVGGNMLTLWIFGDNVEDRLGHGGFLLFYLAAGLIANLAQTWSAPDAALPLVGASGAIAAVMGAYFVLYPHSRVLVLVFLLFFINIVEIPAILFLGIWFLMQLFGGVGQIGQAGDAGGVAFWAHASGFLTGVASMLLLRLRQPHRPWDN
jgi:membrane associated rhomboid family serine protease